jgi:glucosamine kinase
MSQQHPTFTALGLDAGGTATRWAVADAQGAVLREGAAGAISGLQLADGAGPAAVLQTLQQIAAAVTAVGSSVTAVAAGITGLDAAQVPLMQRLLAQAFGAAQALACNDIELLCRAHTQPGSGALVLVAGTGSIAAALDAAGLLQRAGGRGVLIDDAGGGAWIALQALRLVWRAEDAQAGASERGPLAQALAAAVGGAGWAAARQRVYGASRGELGLLALAVAEAAHAGDADALALLQRAGYELARLVRALAQRLAQPPARVLLSGRVFDLHPAVATALGQALPPHTPLQHIATPAHHAAAGLASRLVHDRGS